MARCGEHASYGMDADFDEFEGGLWLALGRLCRSQSGGCSCSCVRVAAGTCGALASSSTSDAVPMTEPGSSSTRTAEPSAEMNDGRWRVARPRLGEALPEGW